MPDEEKKGRPVVMGRYRNVHTSAVGPLAPGAEGDVDTNNPGIKVAIKAKQLVSAGGLPEQNADAQNAELTSLKAQLAEAQQKITTLETKNAELERRALELETRPSGQMESMATVTPESSEWMKPSESGHKNRRG